MKKGLFVRLSELELEILKTYCEQTDRTQSDVIRDFVRSLAQEIVSLTPIEGGRLTAYPSRRSSKHSWRGASGDELNSNLQLNSR